jgi:hypothetical protein
MRLVCTLGVSCHFSKSIAELLDIIKCPLQLGFILLNYINVVLPQWHKSDSKSSAAFLHIYM